MDNNKINSIENQTKCAFEHRHDIQALSSNEKNTLLHDIAAKIIDEIPSIITENTKDMDIAKTNNTPNSLLDRLLLTEERIVGIADSIRDIASLPDPIGAILDSWERPNGLSIKKVRVPLGCIGMIYEARPNVTADAIAIAIKTNNAIVLRGSASAYHSNLAITSVFKAMCSLSSINPDFIQLLEDVSREGVKTFVSLNQYLDLIIPRGGASLIQNVIKSATVPTIETGVGLCHLYIDEHASLDIALDIADNSKTHRPSVCNACETLLVHKNIAADFLPEISKRFSEKNVEIKGCVKTQAYIKHASEATEEDWKTEYHGLTISIKVVTSTEDAISHINQYGTLHTEAIVSNHQNTLDLFSKSIDASTIITNASTRFTDGGEFGFGAEIGISTQKLHARGPMGINELTSYKYIVEGSGQVR
ncbi:glutamate-5-semialdehyde dehydrogenase [Candidatus Marinamargulisbacteria bacterium SCGC AG-343-D04]|nr:glutamate-5-semialdehyde dehydrogenase [Candidatus Marinamargulisbacteria bacterium SCGC AG-343-D04]